MTRTRLGFVVLAAALVAALSMGIRQAFGLFLQPITMDLSLSRESFALAIALQNLIWGLTQPLAGMLADRYGSGRVLVLGGATYTAGLALTAFSADPLSLQLTLGVLVGLGLSGTTWVVVLGAVGRLVSPRHRSLALGLITAGGSIGLFAVIPATQWLLGDFGWVAALLILAAAAASVPLLAGFLRSPATAHPHEVVELPSMRAALAAARDHRGYWLLNAGFFVCGFHVAFIATHLPAYLTDSGIEPRIAALALALIGLFNIAGAWLCGVLGGRYSRRHLLSLLYAARAVIIALFLLVPLSNTSALVFSAAIGLLWLGTIPLTSGLVGNIFGVRYLSTLFGIVFMSHQFGSFLGAWLGGYVYDLTGSYNLIWGLSVALGVLAAVLHMPIDEAPLRRPDTTATVEG